MDHGHVDRLARALAAGVSRRSVFRRAAGSAMTSPLALFGISAAAAQDNKDKKDKGNAATREGVDRQRHRGVASSPSLLRSRVHRRLPIRPSRGAPWTTSLAGRRP